MKEPFSPDSLVVPIPRPSYRSADGESLEEKILNTLVGTSRTTRLGPRPDEDTLRVIGGNIKQKIRTGEPLDITSAWGARKTLPGYEHGADLAEILALDQYNAIHEAIKNVYPPGVRFHIVLSDSYYTYLYGENPGVQEYAEEMAQLLEGYEQIDIAKTSELHEAMGDEVLVRCAQNLEALRNYWHDSEHVAQEAWGALQSYNRLKDMGWIGQISPAVRRFYIDRMKNLFPDETDEQHTERVLKFFAYGLVLKQYDVFKRADSESCTADFCLLRVPPPDMPKALHGNRLRIRCVPSSITNQSAPPWTVEGAFVKDNETGLFKPRLITDARFALTALGSVSYKNRININLYETR